MEPIVNFRLITNEITLKKNNITGENFTISPKISRRINKVFDDEVHVELIVEMLNTDENPFPYDIRVSVTGIFDISKLKAEDKDTFIKIQSTQFIFPQIRSIISSLTSIALLPPILLPIIDARTTFEEN